MTQEQLAALKVNLQRELEFCDRKCGELRQLIKHEAPLTDVVMAGVTYDRRGLGGTYGGIPRARQSMLDGIWNHRSDVETEEDTGSEATDLGDSVFGAVGDLGDDATLSSGEAAPALLPFRGEQRLLPVGSDSVTAGRMQAASTDGSSSAMVEG
jgi:hypothetical protein